MSLHHPQRDSQWRYAVLDYDFDASSKDDYIQARFRNEIVRVRKAGPCAVCFGTCEVGTLARREVVKMDDEVLAARYCQDCCDAMATWPDTDHMEQRYTIGQRRAENARRKGG